MKIDGYCMRTIDEGKNFSKFFYTDLKFAEDEKNNKNKKPKKK